MRKQGIEGLLIDIDNTLVAWDADDPHVDVRNWVKKAQNMGFQVVLVTNNKLARLESMKTLLFITHGYSRAQKPSTRILKKAMRIMDLNRNQTAIIGDQIFTDVLGGNRLGLFTVLVTPVKSKEFWWTTGVRHFEKRVLRRMEKFVETSDIPDMPEE